MNSHEGFLLRQRAYFCPLLNRNSINSINICSLAWLTDVKLDYRLRFPRAYPRSPLKKIGVAVWISMNGTSWSSKYRNTAKSAKNRIIAPYINKLCHQVVFNLVLTRTTIFNGCGARLYWKRYRKKENRFITQIKGSSLHKQRTPQYLGLPR